MEKGKELIYTREWYKKNYGEQNNNVCSPLSFCILFNDEFFIKTYHELIDKNIGLTINQENKILSRFVTDKYFYIQQYNVFETNGKFSIPKDIMLDIWQDSPESLEECFVYFLGVATDNGWHKQIIIQTKDRFHLIDSNYKNVLVYEDDEFLKVFYFNRLTNLSILMNPDTNAWIRYKVSDFLHLL